TITGQPPHRSVRARLRIRLLPRMNGVEALVGIWMQNTGLRNPPIQQWVETVPPHPRTLTATDQSAPPQSAYATPEDTQLTRVAGYRRCLSHTIQPLGHACSALCRKHV